MVIVIYVVSHRFFFSHGTNGLKTEASLEAPSMNQAVDVQASRRNTKTGEVWHLD